MRRIAPLIALLCLLVLLLAGCWPCPACPDCPQVPTPTPAPTVAPTATPAPNDPWAGVKSDPRIKNFAGLGSLNIKIYRCLSCRYKVSEVFIIVDGVFNGAPDWAWDYVGVDGAGGATHTFAVVRKIDGSPLVGKTVLMSWPDGSQGGVTKADGSVNFYTNAVYFPDRAQTGPYCVNPLNGDQVCGGGLPYGNHVSLWVVYDEVNVLQSTDESMGVIR